MLHRIPAFLCSLLFSSAAFAQSSPVSEPGVGHAYPHQWLQMGAATPIHERLTELTALVHYMIFGVVALVLVLGVYICLRFNRRANPVPSRTTHNTLLEFAWTVAPIILLVAIAIPSLRLHYDMDTDVEADMTVKITGHQWYWSYQYPDQGGFEFDSYIKKDPKDPASPKPEELQPGELRLLEVDNRIVVPVDATVRLLVTSADVIHSWAMPAFGVKRDAVPGRLNEAWFKAIKEGVYYGQCSELCGTGHGFMPIAVEVVSREAFDRWAAGKRQAAGIAEPASAPAGAVLEQPKPADSYPATQP